MIRITAIDAHAEGGPLRLVTGGFPLPRGRTMAEKRQWLAHHGDPLRRVLLREPRGHAAMCGAVLTEPVQAGSHAGLIFMDADGYPPMSGHGVIAATTIALERRLLMPAGGAEVVVYDTEAGTVRAAAAIDDEIGASGDSGSRVRSVTVRNVPSFVLYGGVPLKLGARHVRVDVAFGGAFYAIVDSEAAGVTLGIGSTPDLRKASEAISRELEAAHTVRHPTAAIEGIYGTIFTGPPHEAGRDLRCVTVTTGGRVERSPGGTGASAVLAVLAAMGLGAAGQRFAFEGPLGTVLHCRVVSTTITGEHEAVACELTGSAWIGGELLLLVDDTDPFQEGFEA